MIKTEHKDIQQEQKNIIFYDQLNINLNSNF